MPRHNHRHVHLHNPQRRQFADAWGSFTKAVGEAFNPNGPVTPQVKPNGPSTIVRTVFKTMTPENWDGGELTTLSPQVQAPPTPTADPSPISSPSKDAAAQDTTLPTQISASAPSTVASQLAVDTGKPTQITQVGPPLTATTAEPVSTTSAATGSSTNSGASDNVAAKAGIAIGVLAGLFVVFLLVYFAFRKKRNQLEKQRLDDDEKINGPFAPSTAALERSASTRTSPNAPRLSLRPVTQFLPNLNPAHPDRRTSRGAAIAMVPSPNMTRAPGSSPWERPSTSASNQENPFGDHAERLNTPVHDHVPVSPISETSEVGTALSTDSPPSTSPIAGVAAGAVAGGLTRKASTRKDAPKALDLTLPPTLGAVPPSPAGTEFSMTSVAPGQSPGPSTSAAAIAAAGGPQVSAVHRVQLDFKPTLEDEMGLQAGQLVRLLHEYDDGWALCIRLDRSQQGVVPRTCLSTRPVKPRPVHGGPRGPPVNPSGPYARGPNYRPANRPMTPQGGPMHPRPQSPAHGMGRPQSPSGRPMSPYDGRPQSPAGHRPMSPGPRSQSPGPRPQQGRPQSPNGMNRRMSPPGPSPMNQEYRPGPPSGAIGRKPVPGQAY